MTCEWRNLCEVEERIKGGQVIVIIPLRKSFAAEPSYWIDVYAVKKRDKLFWYVGKQWSYVRAKDKQLIDGHHLGTTTISPMDTISIVSYTLEKKLKEDWLIETPIIQQGPPDEAVKLINCIEILIEKFKDNKLEDIQIKQDQNTLKDCQLRRKKEAEWG